MPAPSTESPGNDARGRPRLIIADDHRMFVESLSEKLAREYTIAGVALDGAELLALVSRCPADCLILDVVLRGRNGLALIPGLRDLQPTLKILVVTMLIDRAVADAALAAGATGFVPKDAGVDELKLALSELLSGRHYVSRRVPKTTHRVGLDARHPALQRLTPRQQEIIVLLGRGRTETDIAEQLGVGLSTVSFHKRNLMRVLGFETSGALLRYAYLVSVGAETAQAP